jgi:hypothetical protein
MAAFMTLRKRCGTYIACNTSSSGSSSPTLAVDHRVHRCLPRCRDSALQLHLARNSMTP